MPVDKPNIPSECGPDTSPMSWIERVRRMVEYHSDAVTFIQRASERLPASFAHSQLLLRLWVEADALDGLILPHFGELNDQILEGRGRVDTTRGVSVRPAVYGLFDGTAGEEVVYECGWNLFYDSVRGVSVVLSVAESGVFQAVTRGSLSGKEYRIGYPVTASALQDALISAYVSELTSTSSN